MEIRIDRRAAVKKLRTLVLTPKNEVGQFRSKLEKKFTCDFVPNGAELSESMIGGVKCDILVPRAFSANRVLLYVHGGSFSGGSRESCRSFCAGLADSVSARAVVPEFRLPPTHPFPAGTEDVSAVFNALADENSGTEILIAADGSGASVALASVLGLDSAARSRIKGIILFSPWLDISDSYDFGSKKARDEVIAREDILHAADLYTYASNVMNPRVSPLKADKAMLEGFPEVYIQCGEKEILLSQSRDFCSLLLDNGINCVLDVWPGMMHLFQMADEYLMESHLAVERIGRYVNRRPEDDDGGERAAVLKKNNIDVTE